MEYFNFKDCSIAYNLQGAGPYLFLIHGFPTNGHTWRFIAPELAKNYTTVVIDLPGLGKSKFTVKADLDISAQAERLHLFIKSFSSSSNTIIGHNSGGAIARLVALRMQKELKNLILINTEIPHHRPPWIPFYQKISTFPLAGKFLQKAITFKLFTHQSWGFRELYFDKKLLDKAGYLDYYLTPLKQSKHRIAGALQFLRGINWGTIDQFEKDHQNIAARVLLLWGKHDRTFPLSEIKRAMHQFQDAILKAVEQSCLLPHEEQPQECLNYILEFLNP
ncbi:MAG: alpha/beta hydrolase [Bacteroidota bacterium]